MNTPNQKSRIKKILRIILLSLAGLLILGGISAYLLVHNYVNKMNLIDAGNTDTKSIETDAAFPQQVPVTVTQIPTPAVTDKSMETPNQTEVDHITPSVIATPGVSIQPIKDGAELDATNDVKYDKLKEFDEAIDDNITNNLEVIEDDNVTNVLFIGSDDSNFLERGYSSSMVIISFNQDTEKIISTTLSKNIYVKIPGQENNTLQAAYESGGADLLLATIQLNFKIKIDRFLKMDMFSFATIVDAIGGINLEVDDSDVKKINTYIRDINLLLKEEREKDLLVNGGNQLLNGKQSLAYSRNRYSTLSSSPSGNNQEVVLAIFDKIKKQSLLEMNDVLNTILPLITTNLSENEILALLLMMPTYMDYDIVSWSIPIRYSYEKIDMNGSIVAGIKFDRNIKELLKRIYQINY